MIDLENPRVRMLLVFIGLMAATFLILSVYNLVNQSSEVERMNKQICDEMGDNQTNIGIRMIQGYADSICDCKVLDNGTWNCIYSKERAAIMTKNLTRMMK